MQPGYREVLLLFTAALLLSVGALLYLHLPSAPPAKLLHQRQIQQAAQQFFAAIKNHSAHYPLLSDSQQKDIATALSHLGNHSFIRRHELYAELSKILAQLGDPAAQLTDIHTNHIAYPVILRPVVLQPDLRQHQPPASNPASTSLIQPRWQISAINGELLDPAHPYLSHIDGIAIDNFIAAAKRYLPQQFHDSDKHLAQQLQLMDRLRQDIGTDSLQPPRLTLTNRTGQSVIRRLAPQRRKSLSTTTASKPPFPVNRLSWLSADTAILILGNLDTLPPHTLRTALTQRRLILDLRQVVGDPLPLLQALSKENPTIPPVNQWLAAYRLQPGRTRDYLQPDHFAPTDYLALPQPAAQLSALHPYQDLPQGEKYGRQRIWLIGPHCGITCARLSYFANLWPNSRLAGHNTHGNYSRTSQHNLSAVEFSLSLSTTVFFNHRGELLSGVPVKVDMPLILKGIRRSQLLQLFHP